MFFYAKYSINIDQRLYPNDPPIYISLQRLHAAKVDRITILVFIFIPITMDSFAMTYIPMTTTLLIIGYGYIDIRTRAT